MIQGKEIRIGHYFQDRAGKVLRVDFIETVEAGFGTRFGQKMFIGEEEVHPLTEYSELANPIPLNAEWFEKLGFRALKDGRWGMGSMRITRISDEPFDRFRVSLGTNEITILKFVHELQNLYYAIAFKMLSIKSDFSNVKNEESKPLPALNFTEFCMGRSLYEINYALGFYNEKFDPEKVLEYFLNWEIIRDVSFYRNGKILVNKHSNGEWKTTITINDNAEYMFAGNENCWQYLPKTFSEFISDVLRHEDFDLLLSEKGRIRIYAAKFITNLKKTNKTN